MDQRDPVHTLLSELVVPKPSPDAVHKIMGAARQQPKSVFRFLDPLYALRAFMLLPKVRFAAMAAVLAIVISIGLANKPDSELAQDNTIVAQEGPQQSLDDKTDMDEPLLYAIDDPDEVNMDYWMVATIQ